MTRAAARLGVLALGCPVSLAAQVTFGAQAIPIVTRAEGPEGATRTELRVMAPLLFGTAHLAGGRVMLHAMLNAEGWTMPGGQLATGAWGEGFTDRRHPHTIGHELIVTAADLVRLPGSVRWSLTAGKGFAPFGSDDPMNRPALLFPVNHHWSQILERAVVIAGVEAGPVTLEYGLFNGDEPVRWNQWPKWDRLGDSRAIRALVRPLRGLELQLSHADVKSPEHLNGSGLRHTMWSASGTFERPLRIGRLYAMAEWARTDEEGVSQYPSVLAEAQLTRGGSRLYVRAERTDRPEERIFGDPFRSPRPHNENSNLGITRWTTATAGFGRQLGSMARRLRLEGAFEVEYLHVTSVTGVIFDPAFFYGRNDLWSLSVALRVAMGQPPHRMGRYGVAMHADVQPEHEHHQH